MTRCFIAIELPEEVKKEIISIQKELIHSGLIKGKLTETNNLHLTLKFIGEISEERVNYVKDRLKELKFSSFNAELDKLGVFDQKFVRIIWISLKGKELFDLQTKIDEVLEDLFNKEDRFMAHITIARPKFVNSRKKLFEFLEKSKFKKISFKINKVYLKKSELTSSGPKYSTLAVIQSKEKYNL